MDRRVDHWSFKKANHDDRGFLQKVLIMYSTYDVRKWTDGAAGREKACRFGLPHSKSLNPSHATELGKKMVTGA